MNENDWNEMTDKEKADFAIAKAVSILIHRNIDQLDFTDDSTSLKKKEQSSGKG